MKLRIRGNSIRLRLTKGEVDLFQSTGEVSETVGFGETVMRFSLRLAPDGGSPRASFRDGELSIIVSKDQGDAWARSEDVGIDGSQPIGDGQELRILIEKDFECLSERPGEDDSDAFPNPLAACST